MSSTDTPSLKDRFGGRVRFKQDSLQQLATTQGPGPAWMEALKAGPLDAARGAEGAFSVALQLPGGEAFAAVDRFAQRSLCYRICKGRLHLSERADDLAADLGDGTAEIDVQAIFEYFYFHAIPSPRTIYRGVNRLPPGYCLHFKNGDPRVQRFWQPVFEVQQPASLDEAMAKFRQMLEEAVRKELDGSKPACFLSGGTDSSSVAGMLKRVTEKPVVGYSIGFDAEGYDEMAYARIAAKHFGCEHREYYVKPSDLVSGIPLLAASFDQPFGNSSALPSYLCAMQAKADGVTRLLAGDGGDELYGGNSRYAKQHLFGLYQYVPSPLRRTCIEPLLMSTPLGRLPFFSKAASYVEQARSPMPDRLQMYNLVMRLGLDKVFTPTLLAQFDLEGPLKHQREIWQSNASTEPLNTELAFDWRYTLGESDLPKVRGSVEMAGLSVGFPMLDEDLLAYSQTLPADWKLRGQKLRWFFKESLRGFLPDEIIHKSKHGFGLPFGVWVLKNKQLQVLAQDSLQDLVSRGILRQDFVEPLFTTHLPSYPGYYGEMVWISMILSQWLQQRAPGFRIQ